MFCDIGCDVRMIMADNRSFLKESTQDKSGARFRIILSAAGIIVNVALAYLMNKLNLGFFLDTIGTITVSAIGVQLLIYG